MDSDLSQRDATKSISNMLREPPLEPIADSGVESVEMYDGPKTPAQRDGGKGEERSGAESRTRGALWRFVVSCTEPILSRLRDYFTEFVADLNRSIATLVDLTRSANRRAVATWHSVGALREQTKTLARREDVENLAKKLTALESKSIHAHRLIEVLLNRNILLFDDAVIARTPRGYLLAPNDDLPLIYALVDGGHQEKATFELLDLTLKEDMTFIDVGAHIGVHTLHAARRVGPSGTVIAFEPTPKVFQLLQRSIHLNGLEKWCRCINIAATSTEGKATLHISLRSGYNSLYPLADDEEAATIEVRTATLDNMLQGIKRIHMVKIAAQGAELEVLEGMKQVLADHRDIMLIVDYGVPQLHRLGIEPSEWFGRFFVHGFDVFSKCEQADRWLHIPEQAVSQLPSTNVVFVRPESSLWTILKQHEK